MNSLFSKVFIIINLFISSQLFSYSVAQNLKVSVNDKEILKDFNIEVNPGELHVIMGPNGSGKSTLTQTIAGKENYIVNSGDIIYKDKSITRFFIIFWL